jgi:hypothetical protein
MVVLNMTKFLRIIALCILAFTISPSAQAEVKDSFYFMKDDGVFSDEEKDEEAEYIHTRCLKNPFQSIYYDCGCIAGAFRVQRDAEKLIPQSQILEELANDKESPCVNTATIAGDTYEFCYDYVNIFRARDKNNVRYCKCVANRSAKNFKKNPTLSSRNIEKIKSNAMQSCNKPY